MTHYLVVAHRIAPAELGAALEPLTAAGAGDALTLLVTSTHPLRALKGHTPELEAAARARGAEATAELRARGVHLARTLTGDGAPAVAVADELRAHPERYDAIALVTSRPAAPGWLRGDARAQLEEAAGLPVVHLYPGKPDPWERAPRPRFRRLSRLWARTRPAGGGPAGVPSRRQLLPVLAFMAAYLLGGLSLALTVNPAFLLNDGVAIIVYAAVLGGLLLLLRSESGST
jgi:hypothetical protein